MSFVEELMSQKPEKTNEGDIETESIPPFYPNVPPGWMSSVYHKSEKTQPVKCLIEQDDEVGMHLVAFDDFEPGDCVLEDTSLLQVSWDLDYYLHSPVHGLLAKIKQIYGTAPLDQGYAQVIAVFLQMARTETRDSKSLIWDMLNWTVSEQTPEDKKITEQIAEAIHECIPGTFQDILTESEIAKLIRSYDTNSVVCKVGKGHTAVYPFARLAQHSCVSNCTFMFLDHPEDSWPSRIQFRAQRPIRKGDRITISYISGYQCAADRRAVLFQQYGFMCNCDACTKDPDLTRAFKCWLCDKNVGTISPNGLGLKGSEDWRCLQCGVMLEQYRIDDCLEAEKKLRTVKADKWKGLAQLLGDEVMHYTHYLCFRKLDNWAHQAWKTKDGETTANMVETLLKCAERYFTKYDPSVAQFHEFLGQVRHGMGEAYTARHHYEKAYEIRKKSGHGDTYWAKKTKYMAFDKPLGEFMDGK